MVVWLDYKPVDDGCTIYLQQMMFVHEICVFEMQSDTKFEVRDPHSFLTLIWGEWDLDPDLCDAGAVIYQSCIELSRHPRACHYEG